jgi:hypothetical protein
VLSDNAQSEYTFIDAFFSRPTDIPKENGPDASWDVLSRNDSFTSYGSLVDDASMDDTASIVTSSEVPGTSTRDKRDKARRTSAEHVWKQVMGPVLEYCKVRVLSLFGVD